MSVVNTLVSYLGGQITVKVPTAAVPETGLPPFTIMSTPYSGTPLVAGTQTPVILSGVNPTTAGGFSSYSITASPTSTYMVQVGSISTSILMPGQNFELQLPQGGGTMFFKNIDTTAPFLDSVTTLNAYNLANNTTYAPPSGQVDATKTYFVAKFSEAVNNLTPQSFSVTQNGTSFTTVPTVERLTLTGTTLSTGATGPATVYPAASLYLVAVDNIGSNLSVALKTPPTVLSVQEMNAGPSNTETNSANSIGNPSGNVSWLKVNLEANADQNFLTQSGGAPRLAYAFAGDEFSAGRVTEVTPNYAVQGTNSKVIYLGFNSTQPVLTEAPSSIAFKTNSGSVITDSAGNSLVSSASVTAAQYIDSTGEPVFSKWGDDTTTISDASVTGYATGVNTGSNGLDNYIDSIDLSGITGRLVVNANKGDAYVYVGNKELALDVKFYDRYILNDRYKENNVFKLGNDFTGTSLDSEYVMVGSGGDNYLIGGNQGAITSNILSTVTVKNYQFTSPSSMLPETDIVDYSRLDMGITVNLGDSARAPVTVVYKDGTTQADTIIGFEGVVGSGGNDNIFGSNVGNALAGGAGDDELRGYTKNDLGDKLYNQTFIAAEYGTKGTQSYKEAQFLVDSSDILYGGAGADSLYGGAGRDMLIDLGRAEMWGSDKTGLLGDGTVGLRDSAKRELAENDVFWVRGDGTEKATINNFHLSKDGTGLAGRSSSANDAIMFSVNKMKLLEADSTLTNTQLNNYDYIYSRLTFDQKVINTDDVELVVNFTKRDGTFLKVGSTVIADMNAMLKNGANQSEVVELKWLSKDDNVSGPLERLNPKIDMDAFDFIEQKEFANDLTIAIALELQQAGTVRGGNPFGLMAANLSDNLLDERIYNPGNQNDRILGTAKNDSYEYVVQKFDENNPINEVGLDNIFDIGGSNDVLMFETARIEDLTLSAVRVGRESDKNSLMVNFSQAAMLDGDAIVTNRGQVTWQGHYQEGGRQAAETLQVAGGREYAVAKAVYEYDSKGYVKGGPEITASNARDVIMVGQGVNDKFVFDVDPAAVRATQSARIADFNIGESIDISSYVTKYGAATTSMDGAGKAVVIFKDTMAPTTTNFTLELTFQETVTLGDLTFLYT